MPLFLAPQGETMQVVRVAADAKTGKHLQSLGIMSGAAITLLSDANGNLIVRVQDTRLALDRRTARSIIVGRMSA